MSQISQSLGLNLSSETETKGFDLQAGQSWIYPTNYPIRDYQYNIIQKALLKNTLVSLPTGLGKTFIAAVVMYNFYRWYPVDKVIFMAPTRPLVKQQIDACYDIMAIPKNATIELTGTKLPNSREDIWKEKRVFFITPQILQNDLDKIVELGPSIRCLVFDEAHRAKGNHAYCEVIRKLKEHNKFFRVLALSATPGSNISDVLEVVHNLLISHLEFRTEESLDVHPYVFERNLITVVVPLGEKLEKVREDYLQILEYYTRPLVKYKIIHGNCGTLTKGKIFMTMKDFQQKNRSCSSSSYNEIMKSLNICVTLYHAYELLIRHGLRSFLSFFEEHIDKPLLRGNVRLIEIMNDIRDYLGPEPSIEQLPDGSYPEVPKDTKFGHPKFYKLRDILVSHFTNASETSRVIVFFEYRNSVTEAYALLNQARPILKPRIFHGQGNGVTQRLQINVVKSFREGQCNILLSTCIGEEGLDVGDVDLIVCFDISNKSPIRMVQRMGRTGRKKEGQVIVLVTEGKEQQTLKDCLIHKNNIAQHVLSSKELAKGLNYFSPRLVPPDISPKCEKIYITVKKPTLTKNSSLKEMFRKISSSSSEPSFSPDLQIVNIEDKIPEPEFLWNKGDVLAQTTTSSSIFSRRIEKQRSLQQTYSVKHSKASEILVNLLQFADSKRFNIPASQLGVVSQLQNRNLKQGDIRNMFKSQGSNDFVIPQTQAPKNIQLRCSPVEENSRYDSKELMLEISNYLSIQMSIVDKKCKHCPIDFDCNMNEIIPNCTPLENWTEIDYGIVTSLTIDDVSAFTKSLSQSSDTEMTNLADNSINLDKSDDTFNKLEFTKLEADAVKDKSIADIYLFHKPSSDLEKSIGSNAETSVTVPEKSVIYEAPKSLNALLNKYSKSIIDIQDFPQEKHENINKEIHNNSCDVLAFFKMENLVDLFNFSSEPDSQETVIYSPDIIVSSPEKTVVKKDKNVSEGDLSPILSTIFERKKFADSVKRNLEKENEKLNFQNLRIPNNMRNLIDSPSKFTMDATKISSTPIRNKNNVEEVKSLDNSSSDLNESMNLLGCYNVSKKTNPKTKDIDIDDICELSMFGIQKKLNRPSNNPFKKLKTNNNFVKDQQHNKNDVVSQNLDIDDFCDLSSFGIQNPDRETTQNNKENAVKQNNEANKQKIQQSPQKINSNKNAVNVNENIINLVDSPSPIKLESSPTTNKPSQSQLSITQLLSLVNKTQKNKEKAIPVQKNVDLDATVINDADDDFNFSFNMKRANSSKKNLSFSQSNIKINRPPKQINNLCASKKRQLNSSLESNASEDEFEDKPTPVRIKPVIKKIRKGEPSMENKRKKKVLNPYIENEAELSENDVSVSSDEDESGHDMYETSFVADETLNVDTQMHAKYLQSVKNPINHGRFKIPLGPRINVSNVYSQEVYHENETYLDDSFVVHDDGEEPTQEELSQLEILEMRLKEKRKRKKSAVKAPEASKRRRIKVGSDESD